MDASALRPAVTWGTNPAQSVSIDDVVPDPAVFTSVSQRQLAERALTYMDLKPGTAIRDIGIDTVFIGSCTNGRWRTCAKPPRSCAAARSTRGVRGACSARLGPREGRGRGRGPGPPLHRRGF